LSWTTRIIAGASPLLISVAAVGCTDGSQIIEPSTGPDSISVSTSVLWNQRAVALVVARPPASNAQAAVSRILTYVSIAQYRAALAAEAAAAGTKPVSVSAAVGGASAAVLESFYPLDVASIEAQLTGDLAVPSSDDLAAGEAIGRAVGAAVLTQAASDNYLVVSPGVPPVGPGRWVSSSAAIVRSLHGARPFFMTSGSQLRSPPPPAIGSAQFTTALAEVRQIADTRTAAQIAIANAWNTASGTYSAGALNLFADTLILKRRVAEADAARILAYANAAAFDAQIACWDTKFAYWYNRPSQADPGITMSIALPNHPSYPSGHSCMTAAFMGVLAERFTDERARLDAMVDEAGMSRLYGGIHHRFDVDAGRQIGRAAAALALNGSVR